MSHVALPFNEIATFVTIIGGMLAAAYTMYKLGKSQGDTAGFIRGKDTADAIVDKIRSDRDDARHSYRVTSEKCKTLEEHITVLQSRSPDLDPKIKSLLEIRDKIAGDDVPLWRIHHPQPIPRYHESMRSMKLRVVTVANEKGGVGKTTTVANLAGFFDKKMANRVLVIDLDHQGSSSTMLLQAAEKKVEISLA